MSAKLPYLLLAVFLASLGGHSHAALNEGKPGGVWAAPLAPALQDGDALLLAQKGKPRVLPKIAKPPAKTAKPKAAAKPKASASAKGASLKGRTNLPKGQVAVSSAAGMGLTKSVRSSTSGIKKPGLTASARTSAIAKLRSKSASIHSKPTTQASLYKAVSKNFVAFKSAGNLVGRIKGNNSAEVNATNKNGHVFVNNLNRKGLPKGSGGALLAKTLKEHGVKPKKITFSNIREPKTRLAHTRGVAPSKTLLAQTARNTLSFFGLKAGKFSFRTSDGKLHMDVGVQ